MRRNAPPVTGELRNAVNRAVLVLSLAIPLAACGSKPQVNEKNASVEEVADKVRAASNDSGLVKPGKWLSTVTVEQIDMPGMPPQVAAQMKKMMVAKAHTTESCLTREEAKQPQAKFFAGNDQCRYDHFTMGSGKIDAQMHCSAGGTTQVMQMNGTYSPTQYQMHMKSQTEGGKAGEAMTMQMTVDAKRLGQCTGKES